MPENFMILGVIFWTLLALFAGQIAFLLLNKKLAEKI
jgi:hypothetical protein